MTITSLCVDGTARHAELVRVGANSKLGFVTADLCPVCGTAWVHEFDKTRTTRYAGTLLDDGSLAIHGQEVPPGGELPGPPWMRRHLRRELGLDEPAIDPFD